MTMPNLIKSAGLDIGGRYKTADDQEYTITHKIPGNMYGGVRNDKSTRLFYEDGQYVGFGVDRDIVGYSTGYPTGRR